MHRKNDCQPVHDNKDLICKSVEAEKDAKATVYTTEAHEGEREQTSREHHNSHATHTLGNVAQFQLFAHTSKNGQCQSEANGGREGISHALQQVEVFLDNKDGHTQHSTVGGDERKEDAQGLIECGRHLLEDNLNHLYQ